LGPKKEFNIEHLIHYSTTRWQPQYYGDQLNDKYMVSLCIS